jgi:LPS-assembly protein
LDDGAVTLTPINIKSFTEFTIHIRRISLWCAGIISFGGVILPNGAFAAQEREWKNVYPDYGAAPATPAIIPHASPSLPIQSMQAHQIAANADSVTTEMFPAPSNVAPQNSTASSSDEQPVDLIAERLEHDEATQTVTASGNVELVQAGKVLKADSVSYNLLQDKVYAKGNVILTDVDGTVYTADNVELTQDMKNGFVQGLHILLTDGSRFTAEKGTRTGGTVLDLKQASYTPCEPCKNDPSKKPLWQLRAAEVTHHETEKRISYRDAWFEFMGVPLAYTPYFSHPDGTETQKSGILAPSFGYGSRLGASYEQQYYYAIAPDKDATVGAIVATDANPVALAEYRQRFDNAEFELGGSLTYSDRVDSVAGVERYVDDELRGHIYGNGLWNINENWRAGFDVAATTDEQYLRQYDFKRQDILENELYVERFEDRDYLVGRVMAFQDLRLSQRTIDQPAVLPEAIASFYGDPNGMLGGRWNMELSALGLYRDGNGQDVARTSAELGWQKRYVTGFGLVNTFDVMARGDAYSITDRNTLVAVANNDDTQTRGFALANWQASYPLVNRFDKSQIVVEPIVSLTAATNVDYDGGIPNEDSQDFTLDPTNIFEPNRFPGHDMIEDNSHVTYGMRTGWYGDNGYRTEAFFGQSRRFTDNNNPFNVGSGLSEQESDYVGQVSASLGGMLDVDYRFQLENKNMTSQRHEVDGTINWGSLALNTRYFYANAIRGTDLNRSREQIRQTIWYGISDNWAVNGSVWYDLGQNDGLRQATAGIDYIGQCMNVSLMAERTLTQNYTGDSGTEIMLRIGLKNLGEFQSSGISIGGGSDDDNKDENLTKPNL